MSAFFSGAGPLTEKKGGLLDRVRGVGGQRLAIGGIAFVALMAGMMQMLPAGGAATTNSLAIGPEHIVSAETMGVTARAEEMLGADGAQPASGGSSPAELPEGGITISALTGPPTPTPAPTPRRAGMQTQRATIRVQRAAPKAPADDVEVLFSDSDGGPGIVVAAVVEPPVMTSSAVVNVGRTFVAHLMAPIYTGAASAPAAAVVSENVLAGEAVVIPAGATLQGEAVSVASEKDRAQIVWRSVVINGRTVPISAVGMDGQFRMGVEGKVIRKASRKKGGAGRALAAVGSAVSFGLIRSRSNVGSVAADRLASSIGSDIERTGTGWLGERDDKVIFVGAGAPVVVYLQCDFKAE